MPGTADITDHLKELSNGRLTVTRHEKGFQTIWTIRGKIVSLKVDRQHILRIKLSNQEVVEAKAPFNLTELIDQREYLAIELGRCSIYAYSATGKAMNTDRFTWIFEPNK